MTMFFRALIALTLASSFAQALSIDSILTSNKDFPGFVSLNPAKTRFAVHSECSTSRLRSILKNSSFSEVQKWVTYCERQLRGRGLISMATDLIRQKMSLEKPQRYSRLTFTLENGETLQGILALKEAHQKLPLIIIRAGLYAHADFSSTVIQLFLNYFEHAPFHVLVLENPSNEHYVSRNRTIRLGGVSGAWQIIDVVKTIKRTKYASRFLEYHLVGYSLGGHEALYANIFSTYDPEVNFKSVTALCPAVDLEATVGHVLNNGGLLGSSNANYLRNMVQRNWDKVPALRQTADPNRLNPRDRASLRHSMVNAAAAQLAIEARVLPRPLSERIQTTDDFLRLSRFTDFTEHVKTPTYVIQSDNDTITPYHLNLGLLKKRLSQKRNGYIHTLRMKYGEHCGFSQTMGLDWMSTLLTGIIGRTTSLKLNSSLIDLTRGRPQNSTIFGSSSMRYEGFIVTDYQITHVTRSSQNGELLAHLKFLFFNPRGTSAERQNCGRFNYWDAPKTCMVNQTATLRGRAIGLGGPFRSTQEINAAITRFNVTASILDANRREILGTTRKPHYIEVPSHLLGKGFY